MRILVIEDEPELREFLRLSLEHESFAVDVASDGDTGSFKARTNDYDLIIMDSLLPKKAGHAVCAELRAAKKHTPVLMLSVQTELGDKISLLNAGADDYVTKPFSFDELIARIRALLRRPRGIEDSMLSVGDLTLSKNKQRVIRGKREIYLTRKEFSLLEYLMRHKGTVVSRGMIMEHVWNSESDPFSNTIEAHILNLRKKIETSKRRRYIYNVPGRGYKIEG